MSFEIAETAKKGSRRPRPARPEDGEEAKRPGISQGRLKKGKAAARKKPEKAGEIRKEGDEGERPIGQAAPAAQGSEAAKGGSAAVPPPPPPPAGVGAAAEAEIIPADGNGSSQAAAKEGPDGPGRAGVKENAGETKDGAGSREEGEGADPVQPEPAGEVWDARVFRSAMEQMARRVMEAGEKSRAQQESSREQQDRLAALESRLRRLEERGRIKRDY
jgi:hypothetical protein